MSIATLKLDESHKMEFGVSITGADGVPQTRFVIETGKFSIGYPCTPTQDGVEVVISELKNIVPAGTYSARLEVIIDNKIYVPFTDTVTFEPLVEIKSTPKSIRKESKKVQEDSTFQPEPQAVSISEVKVNGVKSVTEAVTQKEAPKDMVMARLIARNLNYSTENANITASELVNESLAFNPVLTAQRAPVLKKLLKLVEDAGVEYDRSLLKG